LEVGSNLTELEVSRYNKLIEMMDL